jgi:hypothetical protein
MRTVLVIAGVLLIGSPDDVPQRTAQTVWAQALTAKGGRDVLHGVRTFVIREFAVIKGAEPFASQRTRTIVCEPPGRWWEFIDYRPGRFGFDTHVVDLEAGLEWYASGADARQPTRSAKSTILYSIAEAQFLYFVETAVFRPSALRLLDQQHADVVEADVGGQGVVFYFDRTTHLPIHVQATRTSTLPSGRIVSRKSWYSLSGYRDVSGLRACQEITD